MLPVGFGARDSVLEDFPLFLFSTEQSLHVTPHPQGFRSSLKLPPEPPKSLGGTFPGALGGSGVWLEQGGDGWRREGVGAGMSLLTPGVGRAERGGTQIQPS